MRNTRIHTLAYNLCIYIWQWSLTARWTYYISEWAIEWACTYRSFLTLFCSVSISISLSIPLSIHLSTNMYTPHGTHIILHDSFIAGVFDAIATLPCFALLYFFLSSADWLSLSLHTSISRYFCLTFANRHTHTDTRSQKIIKTLWIPTGWGLLFLSMEELKAICYK